MGDSCPAVTFRSQKETRAGLQVRRPVLSTCPLIFQQNAEKASVVLAKWPGLVFDAWEPLPIHPLCPSRREVSSLTARWHQEEGAVQEALRLLGGLGGRVDGFLGQWERAQREQAQTARGLQELRGRADELCTMVERSAVSVASLRSELEGLGPLKPILEEFGRQFQNSRRGPDLSMNLDRSHQGNCARCASQGSQLSTESLQQLLDRALTVLVDEVKQRGLTPACPSCQRLHKKILELERQALAKHVRAEALSSTLRLAQDEALRAKNLLLTDKMKPEEKMATLDHLHLKMCSLHDHLSNLPLEGSTGTMGGGSSAGTPQKHEGSAPEQ
uniref:Testis specific serine kinase substrate n=1 Tax=Nomascus leucogenys TaxID=61853 RepID=G1QZR8_NOMLE